MCNMLSNFKLDSMASRGSSGLGQDGTGGLVNTGCIRDECVSAAILPTSINNVLAGGLGTNEAGKGGWNPGRCAGQTAVPC